MAMMFALGFAAQSQAGPIGYFTGISTTLVQSLYRIDLANPSVVTTVGPFTGAVVGLNSLDFRPADGLLYGYQADTNRLVTINPLTAVTTFVSSPSSVTSASYLGIDFNPVADRLRMVNTNEQNLRINVDTGATTVDGFLTYAAGDPNAVMTPNVTEVAYTNSDTNTATGTTLYYLDTRLSTLATTSNPNGGVLNTVGSLGVNITNNNGFDILSDGIGGNIGYAILQDESLSPSRLYSINLNTGAATSVGAIGVASRLITPFGLAIVQQTVPEPTSAAIALGLVACGMCMMSRRRAVPLLAEGEKVSVSGWSSFRFFGRCRRVSISGRWPGSGSGLHG